MRSTRAQKRSGRTRRECHVLLDIAEESLASPKNSLPALSLDNYAVPMLKMLQILARFIFVFKSAITFTSSCSHRARYVVMKFRGSCRRVPSGSSGLAIVTTAIETARALFTRHHC